MPLEIWYILIARKLFQLPAAPKGMSAFGFGLRGR
jgi:hypothetical protein